MAAPCSVPHSPVPLSLAITIDVGHCNVPQVVFLQLLKKCECDTFDVPGKAIVKLNVTLPCPAFPVPASLTRDKHLHRHDHQCKFTHYFLRSFRLQANSSQVTLLKCFIGWSLSMASFWVERSSAR